MCKPLFAMLLSVVAQAGAQAPPSPGMVKLNAFVAALNSGDKANVESFVKTYYSAKPTTQIPLAERVTRLFALSREGAPLKVTLVIKDEATLAVVRLKGSDGVEHDLKLTFDADDPHGVKSINMGGPGSQTGPMPKHYSDWKDLPDLLARLKTDTEIPAISAAFAKGSLKESAAVGERELGKPEKVNVDDRWLLGSITKSMTATMIGRLVDQGLMRWNMTIGEALPDTPMLPAYVNVTLLQLLRHRGGIPPDLYVNPEFLAKAAGDAKDLVQVREHYAEFTLGRKPGAKPGESYEYSNAGYSIAAHMAETVAKKPYEALMQELLFDPLDMKSAKFGVPGTAGNPGGPGQIDGHVIGDHGLEPGVIDDPRLNGIQAAAGAGLSMSIADLLKFAQYHLAGLQGHVTLMSSKAFNMLHRPAPDEGGRKYACGWDIAPSGSMSTYHGHNGSDGTFYAEMAIWPEKDLCIVSICNAGTKFNPSPPLQAVNAIYNRYEK